MQAETLTMNSKRALRDQLTDQHLSSSQRAQLRCQLARQLEDQGDYEAARVAMGELWQRIGDQPLLEDLDDEAQAAVLLRAGVLTGWIGSAKQISGAQETAKNLLTESIAIFERLGARNSVAEAQIEIAYSYWREGRFDEGRVLLTEALDRLPDSQIELRAKALLRIAIIERGANHYGDALSILTDAAPLFSLVENHCLKGSFHNQFAIVLRNVGAAESRDDYADRALIEYAAASYHFEEAGHIRYQACVENNLAFLFWKVHRFAEAHEHLDRAQILFARLKDDLHGAQVDETRARVLLSEGRVVDAEKAARRAVRTLENGDEPSWLTEALTSLGIALARLRRSDEARSVLERAVDGAQNVGNVESAGSGALVLIEELGAEISDSDLLSTLERAEVLLEDTQEIPIIRRLAKCAIRVASLIYASPRYFPSSINWAGFSYDQEVDRYGKHLIELALKDSDGSVTDAAHLLDLSHQNLSSKLRRHKELDRFRKPVRQRSRRSVDSCERFSSTEAGKKRRNTKILLVEDNQIVADAVAETLEEKGWAVETCADGTSALEKISGEDEYDLFVFDYDLPGVNGIELVLKARQLDHRSSTPIVMLSATPAEAAAREAGADVFLNKPQGIASLIETITVLLGDREQESGRL
ncbi:MAG TPA: response regulator [Pyrinomonadaceae bacterium]|nr:response regulator [Pyrinomonadaceae bacterium]